MKAIVSSFEHKEIKNCNFSDEQLKEFNECFENEDPKFLGIHQEFDNNEVRLKSYYYIGYRWLDEKKEEYIHISPKKSNDGKQADYLKMFLTCLQDPIVSKQLNETYKIFFDEKWVDIQNKEHDITPFLILHFLSVVKKISRKGLKKGYLKVTENLISKIKGKILVHQTIKHNHFKNRLDKTVCNYQIFTIDCLENQILKTALRQCSRNLHGIQNDDISKLLKFDLNAFELVNEKEVFVNDFSKIKHSPFYKEYKEALQLSQMIFKRFGFTLNSSNKGKNYSIPPFYIDMPELFERYVEVKLRENNEYKHGLMPGYGHKNGNSYEWSLRPDFTVQDKKLIIDAKYKYWFSEENEDKKFKDDFQQLSLYSRACSIRKRIGLDDSNEEAKILFIYPKIDGKESIDDEFEKIKDFHNMYKLGIEISQKEI